VAYSSSKFLVDPDFDPFAVSGLPDPAPVAVANLRASSVILGRHGDITSQAGAPSVMGTPRHHNGSMQAFASASWIADGLADNRHQHELDHHLRGDENSRPSS
jgi:hypothetical protein